MKRLASLLMLALALAAASAAPAAADFGLKDLEVAFEDEAGAPVTTAGSHPFAMTTKLMVNTEIIPEGAEDQETHEKVDGEVPEGELKDLTVTQLRGLIGSQTAVEQCTRPQFATRDESYAACPDESAVGFVAVKAEFTSFEAGTDAFWHAPVYSLEPSPGVAATFGFVVGDVPIAFDVVVSPSPPHNLVVRLQDTPQALLFYGSTVTLWGDPTAAAHDNLRGTCIGEPGTPSPEPISKGTCPVPRTDEALLTLPRSCRGPLSTLFQVTSWQGGLDEGSATTAESTECDQLAFEPEAAADPTVRAASSPSGLDFSIEVEDQGLTEADDTAQADVSAVRVTLPPGLTANPSAAEGQGSCTEAEFAAASLQNPGCPEASKLGNAEISSPLLEEPLAGSLYLAQPRQNPFGSLLAAYLVIRNKEFGVFVSQAGQIGADAQTGQLTTTFTEIPELPFSDLQVHFREGPRAPLVTPSACATYVTSTSFTPSSGNAPHVSDSSFQITEGPSGGPCPSGTPFAPRFVGGSQGNLAGAYSPFYMRFTRSDGEGQISGLGVELPPGVVGKLAGVGRCSETEVARARANGGRAELASPSCPLGSKVGRVVAAAGVGPFPARASGALYLAGPYGGAPLSVVSVVPAVAGPFDLGNAVVRSALRVDPATAQVRVDQAASDPIPTILEGVPLQLRDLELFVDRPEFTLNPTSCAEKEARATLFAGSLSASLAKRYQAQGCSALRFKPALSLELRGGTKRGENPALVSTFRARPDDANLENLVLRLPHSAFLDQAHIRTICTRVQFAADGGNGGGCPKGSVYGHVTAWTPLLDEPLEGPVYLRSSNHALPDLVAALHGLVDIDAVARIDSVKGGLRAAFTDLPDAPLSKVVVRMQGAKKGLIVNSRDVCRAKSRAQANMAGQNGRRSLARPVVANPRCGKEHKRAKRKPGAHQHAGRRGPSSYPSRRG